MHAARDTLAKSLFQIEPLGDLLLPSSPNIIKTVLELLERKGEQFVQAIVTNFSMVISADVQILTKISVIIL